MIIREYKMTIRQYGATMIEVDAIMMLRLDGTLPMR